MDSESRVFFVALAVYSVKYSDSMYYTEYSELVNGMQFFSIPYIYKKGKYYFEIDELNLYELLQVPDIKVFNFLISISSTYVRKIASDKRLLIDKYIEDFTNDRLTVLETSI